MFKFVKVESRSHFEGIAIKVNFLIFSSSVRGDVVGGRSGAYFFGCGRRCFGKIIGLMGEWDFLTVGNLQDWKMEGVVKLLSWANELF